MAGVAAPGIATLWSGCGEVEFTKLSQGPTAYELEQVGEMRQKMLWTSSLAASPPANTSSCEGSMPGVGRLQEGIPHATVCRPYLPGCTDHCSQSMQHLAADKAMQHWLRRSGGANAEHLALLAVRC